MGGHVAFYINSRLCNTAFADEQEQIRQSAVMNRNGSLYIEKYGAANVSFASMCINEPAWRQRLAHTVRYLTHDIGADSIYLDQLAMAPSLKCYHPAHAEHNDNPTPWNQGSFRLTISQAGRGRAVPIPGPCPDRVSIQTMTTMLMGYKRPDYLAKIGRLPTSEATIDMLEDAIEQQTPYISDYF